jgi:hypothetical protein
MRQWLQGASLMFVVLASPDQAVADKRVVKSNAVEIPAGTVVADDFTFEVPSGAEIWVRLQSGDIRVLRGPSSMFGNEPAVGATRRPKLSTPGKPD